jgi:hypothetical protein
LQSGIQSTESRFVLDRAALLCFGRLVRARLRRGIDVEIWVEFDGAKWRISPDPAAVPRGTLVTWRFQASKVTAQQVRWEVYFSHGSPFKGQSIAFTTTTGLSAGQHAGTTGAMSADTPGDYKYGVRAQDPVTQNALGDDDPRLVVTP